MRILSTDEQKLAGLTPIKHPDHVSRYLTMLSAVRDDLLDRDAPGFGSNCRFDLLDCLHADLLHHDSRSHVEVGPAPEFETERYRQEVFYYRIPTQLLLGASQVKALGFSPRPGYLYLAVPPPRDGWLGRWDTSHFKEEDRSYAEANSDSRFGHEVDVSIDPDDERRLVYRYKRPRRGAFYDVAQMLNGRELVLAEREGVEVCHRTHVWGNQGPARIPDAYSEQFHHEMKRLWEIRWPEGPRFLETPFEFPMGFVRETIEALAQERRFQSDPFIESLEQILRGSFRIERNRDEGEPFPHGEPDYLGPDLAWRKVDQPWWFQNLLLARLIGGPMWSNVLGNLDSWLEDPVRWDEEVKLLQEARTPVS